MKNIRKPHIQQCYARGRERIAHKKTLTHAEDRTKEVQKRRHVKFNRASYKSTENLWSSLHVRTLCASIPAARMSSHLTPFVHTIVRRNIYIYFKYAPKNICVRMPVVRWAAAKLHIYEYGSIGRCVSWNNLHLVQFNYL